MDWKQLLAYITGTVDQELLLRNEYLVTENRILRNQIAGRARLTDGERTTLATIGQKLGKQTLKEVATIVKPDTILGWHRKLIAQKFDGSQQRKAPGRPRIDPELEALVVRMAQENCAWGYDRIVGALANLGHIISDQTVGNILKRHGIPPAPERKTTTTWKEFIRTHMEVLVATDFFTAEVWTLGGLVTYYVLFFLRLGTREVHVAGVTPHPKQAWMMQVARNVVQLGKLTLPKPLPVLLQEEQATNGFRILPVTLEHVYALDSFPLHHRDPFDRLLSAQAHQEGLTVVTHDPKCSAYSIPVLW